MRAALVLALALTLPATAVAQLQIETVATGFNFPLGVVVDPLDATTLFVVEQTGRIRVVREGRVLPAPLLDLRDAVSNGGERGLLGLAFSPNLDSRRFFVNFTNRNGDTVVARFRRNAENPLIADADSRFDLAWPEGHRTIDQPFSNHNGGHLAFGPDRYLYIGMGDGGSGGDPMNHAQNPRSLLGKMLRIDVDVDDEDPRGYRVPDDNPFVDGEPIAALGEIWAFGLRNPWQFSFDDMTRGGVGALVIADVGQNAREEINFEPRGASGRNYGWRLREGRAEYDDRRPPAYTPLTAPVHEYDHNVGQSITGGVVYRGSALGDEYKGRYFYADFSEGRVFSIGLHLDDAGEATADDEREHTEQLGGRGTLGLISAFGVDANGELLLVNYSGGRVLRVTSGERAPDGRVRGDARGGQDRQHERGAFATLRTRQ
jgi:glucose/arabinose dehydrogenase